MSQKCLRYKRCSKYVANEVASDIDVAKEVQKMLSQNVAKNMYRKRFAVCPFFTFPVRDENTYEGINVM